MGKWAKIRGKNSGKKFELKNGKKMRKKITGKNSLKLVLSDFQPL